VKVSSFDLFQIALIRRFELRQFHRLFRCDVNKRTNSSNRSTGEIDITSQIDLFSNDTLALDCVDRQQRLQIADTERRSIENKYVRNKTQT
jgi:hypothetical protein